MELIKIFLSYASEDYPLVSDFYDRLKNIGIIPWMDKKDILPGENWERSIWRAVKNADFILLFLSNHSVNKRGFFQKEVKTALKLWEEKLEDDIYIIPVKIEDCEIPQSISSFQWINIIEDNSFNKIISSIKEGATRLGKIISYNPDIISIKNKKIQESKSEELSYVIDVEYPQFEIMDDNIFDEINNIISGHIIDIVQNARKEGLYSLADKDLRSSLSEYSATNDLYINYFVNYYSKEIVSVQFTISTYSAGAAHPLHGILTLNYELNPTLKLTLSDLFKTDFDFLNFISTCCIDELIRQLKSEEDFSYSNNPDGSFSRAVEWIKQGAKPHIDTLDNFCINENGLILLFDDYQVGPYSWGHRKVEITSDLLIDKIVNKSVLDLWNKKFA